MEREVHLYGGSLMFDQISSFISTSILYDSLDIVEKGVRFKGRGGGGARGMLEIRKFNLALLGKWIWR